MIYFFVHFKMRILLCLNCNGKITEKFWTQLWIISSMYEMFNLYTYGLDSTYRWNVLLPTLSYLRCYLNSTLTLSYTWLDILIVAVALLFAWPLFWKFGDTIATRTQSRTIWSLKSTKVVFSVQCISLFIYDMDGRQSEYFRIQLTTNVH